MVGRGGEGDEIPHRLFADDTMVFCQSDEDPLTPLSWVLMWFEALSKLKLIWRRVRSFRWAKRGH